MTYTGMTTRKHISGYFRLFWPLTLALFLELGVLAWMALTPALRPQPLVTPLSLFVSLAVLASGVLPAFLRPNAQNTLVACFAVVFTSLLVIPFEATTLPPINIGQPLVAGLPVYLIFRLANGFLLAPLALHLTARFPVDSGLRGRQIAAAYTLALILLLGLVLVTSSSLRIALASLSLGWFLFLMGSALYQLIHTGRQYSLRDRRVAQQARLLFFAILAAETPLLLRPFGFILGFGVVSYDVVLIAQIIIPLTLAYSVLRLDLFGIDRAVRRAFVYSVLSLALLGVYLGLVMLINALFKRTWAGAGWLAGALSLLVAFVVIEPAHRRVQVWFDRVLYPERAVFRREVEAAQVSLTGVVRRDAIQRLLEVEFPARIGAGWGELSSLSSPDDPGRGGRPPAWETPLTVGERQLGVYRLGARALSPIYDLDERLQLQALASQTSLALAYVETFEALAQLNRELEERVDQRTKQMLDQQRLLAVIEERQRIARDLHDSVTQALFSINLSARALASLARKDARATSEGLVELESAAQQALSEMRLLLAQLRASPVEDSQADQVDLARLLREHCGQLKLEVGADGSPPFLDVALDIRGDLRLPAVLSLEIFSLAREALHNAGKHSRVKQATCRLKRDPGSLLLHVSDSGCGFDPDALASQTYGLQGMRERVTRLGGRVNLQSAPGRGTTWDFQIPLDVY
jgi:signal transduction histidine kinase